MNKITKFLLIILCILAFAYFLLSNYNKEMEDMPSKVGAKIGGGELTMNEYYSLIQYFDTYKDYVSKKEYKSAYSMLGASYRNYLSYDEYESKISKKEMDKLQIDDVNIITASTFEIVTDISGEKEIYSIIIDKQINKPKIYPESFLDYKNVEISKKQKNVKCILKDYIVNNDKCILNFEINNNNKNKFILNEATLYTNLADVVKVEEKVEVNSKEVKSFSLSFDTDYAFPNEVVLKGAVGDKDIELVFKINNW